MAGLVGNIAWREQALVRRRAFAIKPCRIGSGAAAWRGAPRRGGQRFESPQLHQEVRANRRDFLRRRIARHFRSLWPDRSLGGLHSGRRVP